MFSNESIIALATPSGAGAIAVIRISGKDAITIASKHFKSIKGKKLITQKSHTILLGHIVDGNRVLDEVLLSVFKGPNSYTGENIVEISCHGSAYIQQEIIQLFLRNGCKTAEPGEFTLRAFLNGKIDLSQAEAVADVIASDNAASHQIAIQQMRGGFSNEIKELRAELMNFASLIELELDFAEEDVEFANRDQFQDLINRIQLVVSDIAGTTRDTIEDEISINGIGFRFIDTAGIRETKDVVEGIGIKKTFEKIKQAQVVLYLVDGSLITNQKDASTLKIEVEKIKNQFPQKSILLLINKSDKISEEGVLLIHTELLSLSEQIKTIYISAKTGKGVEDLKSELLGLINTGALRNNETIVTNSRHYNSLLKALEEIQKVQYGMDAGFSGDLLAIDIRQALYHFGEITGEITSDDLLGNIFANFCIGK